MRRSKCPVQKKMGINPVATSPRSSSRPSTSSDPARWLPTPPCRQLACMEQELEHFLSEVRNRQGTLGAEAGKERGAPNLKKGGLDKLRITVYEIADGEQPVPAWGRGRGRKRKLK